MGLSWEFVGCVISVLLVLSSGLLVCHGGFVGFVMAV